MLLIHNLGILICLAILVGLFIVWKQARQKGLSEEKVFDTFLLSLMLGLVGARLGFVIDNWAIFAPDFSRIILLLPYPGFSFAYGLLFGLIVVSFSGFLILDIFALALALAVFICTLSPIYFIPVFLLFLLRKNADLERSHGIFFSAYLIFLTASLLMVDKSPVCLGLLFISLIIFMIKFPASVLGQIRGYLEQKYKDAEHQIRELRKEDPFEESDRLLDRASDDSEASAKAGHERVAALQQQMNMVLVQTRKALTKIKIGKYGICENCKKMIDTDRLAAMPTAVLCLNCEKKREK